MKLSVEVYIKKNTLVVSGKANADNTSPFLTIANNITMTTNQYVGHYVKVTSGESTGLISWILSNTTTVLTLETAIPILNGDNIQIYRSDYQRLDLFKDEKISITSQIGNANDIGKLYTDYTQSFTIPASKNNNQILSHWYESSIDNGFDHRMRYDAFIEVNTHRFKNGTIQLEKADKKNGFIESYSVTFYGNLVQLKDIIKDDKLNSLDYTSLNHTYNSGSINNRILFDNDISTGLPYKVRYPLIGNSYKYEYQTGSLTNDITLSTGAIKWNDLFPAIPLSSIFSFIQAKYGVIFTGSFFNLNQWKKLHLYLKNALSMSEITQRFKMNYTSIVTTSPFVAFPEFNLTTDTLTSTWSFVPTNAVGDIYIYINITVTPLSGFTNIPYSVFCYRDGEVYRTFTNLTGTRTVRGEEVRRSTDGSSHKYTFFFSSAQTMNFTSEVVLQRCFQASYTVPQTITRSKAISGTLSTISNIDIVNYIPDIKTIDFLTGIIKTFNLMIIPRDNNTYEFAPLEMFYNAGKTLEITEYTYENEMSINKPKLFKSINFKYEESKNVLNEQFKSLYGNAYGDLIYNSERITENSTYEIKLPFENVLFEVPTQGKLFQTATLVDKDLNPYIPKPMLIYMSGRVTALTGSDRIYITQSSGSPTTLVNYQRFSNEYDNMPTDVNHAQLMTMNFGNEQSSWLNELAPQGLYFRHYKNFVDNLYNIKTRLVKVKALLPASLLGSTVTNGAGIPLGIALNDRLVIRNKRYLINSFTTDLTTGETDFELLTDYRGVNAASTVGYRFADMENIQTDKDALVFDVEIYLNDYDSFDIKASTDFLSYTHTSNNKTDALLTVTVPVNSTGLDRTGVITLEYKINGATVKTEYIFVIQTAI
jgi:hypothetical protein